MAVDPRTANNWVDDKWVEYSVVENSWRQQTYTCRLYPRVLFPQSRLAADRWWQVFRVAVENDFAIDWLKATWRKSSRFEGWKLKSFQRTVCNFGICASEANYLFSYSHSDLWPLVADLPMAATCRMPQEMLPAESGRLCPNVSFDLWPSTWIDCQLSSANNNAAQFGKHSFFMIIKQVPSR